MTTAYWVEYGHSAFLGCFAAADDVRRVRGDRVVVRGPRGLELGAVLCEALESLPPPASSVEANEIVRSAAPEDETTAARLDGRGQELLIAARDRAEALGLPLELIDVEVLLDERSAVLHGLSWEACDATPLFTELSARFGWAVMLLDLSRLSAAPAEEAAGCGKPGCGAEKGGCSSCGTGGGCSSGSCSRGKVHSAEELTNYFADLRVKMEAESTHRVPLA